MTPREAEAVEVLDMEGAGSWFATAARLGASAS